MKRILAITTLLLMTTNLVFGADQKVVIRDPDSSGRQAAVSKIGADDALLVFTHSKKFMICNKDDDASPNYYGFEAADGSYFILKETVSAGADTYQYDRGASGYSTAWTNRTSGSYQNWGDEY